MGNNVQTETVLENEDEKKGFFKKLREPSKKVFWIWVIYQAIKGTLTTAFIWIPLLYLWFQSQP